MDDEGSMPSNANRPRLTETWLPAAILPNISVYEAIDGEVIALVPPTDPRIQTYCVTHSAFTTFLSRFTDAFRVPIDPAVLIVREDALAKIGHFEALASFRDLLALSVIPYGRAMSVVYPNSWRVRYSTSFWLYPWMLAKDGEDIVARTLAMTALHTVHEFHGQSSPELPHMCLSDLDSPLLESLLLRWERTYLGKRQRWVDRALFRSLNMAMQAAQLPDVTLYDLGRSAALWVSAFEILAHPRTEDTGLRSVYSLFEKVAYQDRNVRRSQYCAYAGRRKSKGPVVRRPLPCWLYGRLYEARNKFLHGSPVHAALLHPPSSTASLFWLAAPLYRLALTGFLGLSFTRRVTSPSTDQHVGKQIAAEIAFDHFQSVAERALLRGRKTRKK